MRISFREIKSFFKPSLLFLALLPAFAHAENFRPFGLTLDLEGQGAFGADSKLSFAPGAGAAFFADWRPVQLISLGTGFSFNDFSASESFTTASWNLGGRLFPFGSDKKGEWYLQGTLGMNLETATFDHEWPGSFHGTAGVGYRMAMGEGNALDLGAQYDLYSPLKVPMSAVGVKVGWTWLFGPQMVMENDAVKPAPASSAPKPVATPSPVVTLPAAESPVITLAPPKKHRLHRAPAQPTPSPTPIEPPTPTPAPAAENSTTYTLVFGDNLDSIAIAFYGEGDLYPILVDANIMALRGPEGLKAGVVLKVPQGLTEEERAAARGKADLTNYLLWEKTTAKSTSASP